MSKDTDKSLFIVSSMPRLYQQLFSGIANYQTLGNRIIRQIKVAHAFRQVEHVCELARLLINIPIKEYRLIGQYYLVWCQGRAYKYDNEVLETITEQTRTYKAKALLSRAGFEIHQGHIESGFYYYTEAFQTIHNVSDYIELSRCVAVAKSIEGFHVSALKDLERLIPLIRHAEPLIYYDYLNSYAVELLEAGRKQEARNIIKHVISSPFAHAYPEWQQTARDLREPNRSFVAIPLIKREHVSIQTTVAQHASQPITETKPEPRANVLPFKLKEAPKPQKPHKLSAREINELNTSQKRELVLAAIRSGAYTHFDYDRFLVMVGLLEVGPADKILDLEDDQILDDIGVIWANHVGPDNFAAVLSALRDCDDKSRQSGIIDRLIKIAFQQTHLSGLTEEAWRLRVERRLPEK